MQALVMERYRLKTKERKERVELDHWIVFQFTGAALPPSHESDVVILSKCWDPPEITQQYFVSSQEGKFGH